jgi:hypothetical protein
MKYVEDRGTRTQRGLADRVTGVANFFVRLFPADPRPDTGYVVAPENATPAQDVVPLAADGSPDRRKEAGAGLTIHGESPRRVVFPHKAQENPIAAPTRAQHRCTPEIAVLADDVQHARREGFRDLFSELRDDGLLRRRLEPPPGHAAFSSSV